MAALAGKSTAKVVMGDGNETPEPTQTLWRAAQGPWSFSCATRKVRRATALGSRQLSAGFGASAQIGLVSDMSSHRTTKY